MATHQKKCQSIQHAVIVLGITFLFKHHIPLKGDFLPSSQIYFHVDWGERGRSENVGRVAFSEMMVRIWLASADDISLNLEGRRWIF